MQKWKIGLAGLLACVAGSAPAAEYLNFGGVSRHFERDLGYNEANYGIGYERDWEVGDSGQAWREDVSFSMGVYKNSIRRATFYFLANYLPLDLGSGFRAGVSGGLLSGYRHAVVVPTLLPSIEWRGERIAVQGFVVPTMKPYVDGAIVVQFKYRFGD